MTFLDSVCSRVPPDSCGLSVQVAHLMAAKFLQLTQLTVVM